MTKQQKTDDITELVKEKRKFYSFQEFADMVVGIWQALDAAQAKAVEGSPP